MLEIGPAFAAHFTLNPDGTFSYTHDGSDNLADSFTYHAHDGLHDSNTTTVAIAIEAPVLDTINFNEYTVDSYGGGNDVSGTYAVEDAGSTLHVWGNTWKKIDFPYRITADTIIEFDFKSAAQGEVHAIGFDTDLNKSSNYAFELYGTQTWGIQTYNWTFANSG